jgi:hypothetical protein
MGSNKPVLMVIDEIDGATGDGVSMLWIKYKPVMTISQASGFVNKLIQITLDKPKAKSNPRLPFLSPPA